MARGIETSTMQPRYSGCLVGLPSSLLVCSLNAPNITSRSDFLRGWLGKLLQRRVQVRRQGRQPRLEQPRRHLLVGVRAQDKVAVAEPRLPFIRWEKRGGQSDVILTAKIIALLESISNQQVRIADVVIELAQPYFDVESFVICMVELTFSS